MPLTGEQRKTIEGVIRRSLSDKFRNYKPNAANMPFHFRLLGQDRMALFSFVQSINTTFGGSVFEPVAETLATLNFASVKKQYEIGDAISRQAQSTIQEIINGLTTYQNPDKPKEVERIRKVCRKGEMNTLKPVKADLFIRDHDGTVYLFDLKTAKPNKSNFRDFKRTLLEWTAIFLAKEPKAKVNSYIAIPYNPYEPKPYKIWTMSGVLDSNHDLKVAEGFWNFLSGSNVYPELLDCFEKVGIEMRPEIDAKFSQFEQ